MSDESSNRGLVKFNAWWLAAAVLVLAVVAALVLILIFGSKPAADPEPTSAPSTKSAQPTGDAEPPATGTPCDLPVGTDIPTAGPDADWTNHRGFLAPFSDKYVAQGEKDSEWACFAHSPTGALFASANFMAGLQDSTDLNAFQSFIEAAAVDNSGRATFIADNSDLARPRDAGRTAQISGFRFESVESDEAIVRIGLSQSAGAKTVTAFVTIAMVWDSPASTWLVDTERVTVRPTVDPLSGYTAWSASQ